MPELMELPGVSQLQQEQETSRNASLYPTPVLPGIRPDQTPEAREIDRGMQIARERVGNTDESSFEFVARRAMPFISTVERMRESGLEADSRLRISSGQGTAADYADIAKAERYRNVEQQRTVGETALSGAAHMVGFAGEMAAAGGLARGLGLASPSLFSRAGILSTAAITAATPATYGDRWIQNNIEAGRSATDFRGLPGAAGVGFAQTAVLGSLGGIAGNVGGPGWSGAATRLFTRTAAGLAEQQGIDVAGSAIDDVAHMFGGSLGTTTHYGLIGHLARGEGNQALREGTTQALMFAVFAGLHEAQNRPPGPPPPSQALVRVEPRPGLPPESPLAQQGVRVTGIRTNEPVVETPPSRRLAGPQIVEGTREYLNEMGRQGLSPEQAGVNLRTVTSSVGSLLTNAEREGTTREAARNELTKQFPPGPARDYALHLVDRLSGFAEIGRPEARAEPQHPVQAAAEKFKASETALAKANQDLVAMKARGVSTASPRYQALVKSSKTLFEVSQANRMALRNAMRIAVAPAENAVPTGQNRPQEGVQKLPSAPTEKPKSEKSPVSGRVRRATMNPDSLTPTEIDQATPASLEATRKATSGGKYKPIITIEMPDGEHHILDGHHTAIIASQRNHKVPVLKISKADYDALRAAKFSDLAISQGVLRAGGHEKMADAIAKRFDKKTADAGTEVARRLTTGQNLTTSPGVSGDTPGLSAAPQAAQPAPQAQSPTQAAPNALAGQPVASSSVAPSATRVANAPTQGLPGLWLRHFAGEAGVREQINAQAKLTPKESAVLWSRLPVEQGGEGKTLDQVGKEQGGVSRQRIEQVEKKARAKAAFDVSVNQFKQQAAGLGREGASVTTAKEAGFKATSTEGFQARETPARPEDIVQDKMIAILEEAQAAGKPLTESQRKAVSAVALDLMTRIENETRNKKSKGFSPARIEKALRDGLQVGEASKAHEAPRHPNSGGERLSTTRGAAEPASAQPITPERIKAVADLSPHHAAALKKAQSTIMAAKNLPIDKKVEYLNNQLKVLSNMPETAAALHSAGLRQIDYHASLKDLNVALAKVSVKVREAVAAGDIVGGMYDRGTGTMSLDGGTSESSGAHITGHEAAHAIDGPKEAISNSPEIKEAYLKEGLKGKLGEYARQDPHEFLAEALGSVYSGELSPADLKSNMPLTYEALVARDLIKPAEGRADFKKPDQVFDRPINDGPIHADTLIRDERMHLTPAESINRFMQDESGHLDMDKLREVTEQYGAPALRAIQHVRHSLAELRGVMGPRTTKLSRAAGEALARFNVADTYARFAAPAIIEKVLGTNNSPEFRQKLGAVLTERRLRYMKEVFTNQAFEASAALQEALTKQKAAEQFVEHFRNRKMEPEAKRAEAEVAKAREAAVEASRDSADAIKAKNDVVSIIGKPGSPFKTIDEYKAAFKDQAVSEAIKRYEQHVVPVMEEAFKRSQGMEPDDPINSLTQIPGSPINLKANRAGQTPTTVKTKEGNLRNEKLQKNKFSRQAYGSSEEGYDIDISNIIENSLSHQLTNAAKAEAVRVFEEQGLAHWSKPGENIDFSNVMRGAPTRGVRFEMKPPPGTQASLAGQSILNVHPEAAGELRRALRVDEKLDFKTINAAMRVLTTATLASTAEITYHTKNQLSFLMKPGMRPHQIFGYFRDVVMKKPEVMNRIVELARIGTVKEHGMESGMAGGNLNPLTWIKFGGKFLDLTRKVLVLMGDDAYDRLVNAGLVKDTQTGRRDFINQLGQYNKQAAHKAVKFLRDTQIGPFATAAVNAPFQAVRALAGGHGAPATSLKADLQMRAATIAKYIGIYATTAIINSAVWGMATGSDDTPFGAIRVGTSPDGRSRYIDILDLIGLKRGLRFLGLLSLMEGKRQNKPTPEIIDKAGKDFVNTLIHPAAGPGVQFGLTGAFGVDARGFHTVERAQPGQSQLALNMQAAAMHANPALHTVLGHENKDKSGFEKTMELLGPFGVRTAPRRH